MSEIEGSMIKRRFGRLVVIDRADDYVSPKGIHYPKWLCEQYNIIDKYED